MSFSGFGSLDGGPVFFGDADMYFTMQLKNGDKCSVVGHSQWYLLVVSDLGCSRTGNGMGQVGIGLEQLIDAWDYKGKLSRLARVRLPARDSKTLRSLLID